MTTIAWHLARLGLGITLLALVAACAEDNGTLSQNTGGASVSAADKQPVTSPARLADIGVDTFLVTDYVTGDFQRVDKTTLRTIKNFNLAGQATGIAWHDGHFFVGNKATRSVDVFGSQGKRLYQLGGRTGEFASVNDLAIGMTVTGNIVYVLDTRTAVVRLFAVDGTDTGATIGAGILKRPTALTFDPENGNLLISDFGDPATGIQPAIRIFDSSGNQINVIWGAVNSGGMMGGTVSNFSTPQGLCVDDGYVFVVDALAGEVQMFRLADKARVKVLGTLGIGDGQLRYPLDVMVDAVTKDVFVADNGNRRITVFRAGGVLP